MCLVSMSDRSNCKVCLYLANRTISDNNTLYSLHFVSKF